MSISWHWQDILHTNIQKIYVTGFKTEHRLCENTVKRHFYYVPSWQQSHTWISPSRFQINRLEKIPKLMRACTNNSLFTYGKLFKILKLISYQGINECFQSLRTRKSAAENSLASPGNSWQQLWLPPARWCVVERRETPIKLLSVTFFHFLFVIIF